MDFVVQHLLTVVLLTPTLGALLLLAVPRRSLGVLRGIANLFGWLGFAVSLPLWFRFQPSGPHFQFRESLAWIPSIGARYTLGLDGISLLLVLLTTLLGAVAITSSWKVSERAKEYYVFFLLLQTGMLGVFLALDLFLFYAFWEAMLVPMYFLIAIWGGPRRLYAAIKFFLYTMVGSVLMLLGILLVYFQHGAPYTFDLEQLLSTQMSVHLQLWAFFAFFLAFAIKVPMVPFHTWLPDAHVEAPTAASVILAGVLLKMGAYGFLRFSLPLLPEAARDPRVRGLMVALALIAIIYGGLVSLMQPDMKRLVAYSSVSHMGFITLGIFALNPTGLAGSVIQQINHGISTGALFLVVGVLYERRQTRAIADFGGIASVMPRFAVVTMIVVLSSLGLPLLNGFVGEFTVLQGAFQEHWSWAAWAVSGVVLAAAYLLWMYQRVFFGTLEQRPNAHLHDISGREFWMFVPLLAVIFWIGIYPKPLFDVLRQPVAALAQRVRPTLAPAPPGTVAGGPLAALPGGAR